MFVKGSVKIPSAVHELSSSEYLHGHLWPTFNFKPATFACYHCHVDLINCNQFR